jgi:ABC exporter DevB family membrane fusion protein
MIGQSDIDVKEIELQRSELQLQSTVLTAEQAVESTEIAVRLAEQSRDAAKENSQLFNESKAIESLEKQIELLQIQLESTRIIAPSNSTVLAVMASVGETAGPTPVIDVANLSHMICIAEVHEADVRRLSIGDKAILSSAALPNIITGKVIRIDTMVGSPQMRLPNPMARSDFRAVPVRIDIDPEHQAVAAKLVQLQVDVTITPARATSNSAAKSTP